jgi:hypothetical protein
VIKWRQEIKLTYKRKVFTLLHHPRAVFRRYQKKLYWTLLRIPFPANEEDYDRHWNYISFKDKVVLDFGADYGSTAYFFHSKGAKKIVAVEGLPSYYARLLDNAGKWNYVIPVNRRIRTSDDIDSLIKQFKPDIVKMDIEGAEVNLLHCNSLKDVKDWLIEAHTKNLRDLIVKRFSELGFNIVKDLHFLSNDLPSGWILVISDDKV